MIAKLWSYLLTALTAIGAVAGFFFYAKRQGKKDEQAAQTEKALGQVKEANGIDTMVRNMSDGKLDEQLRSVRRPPPK